MAMYVQLNFTNQACIVAWPSVGQAVPGPKPRSCARVVEKTHSPSRRSALKL